MTERRLSPGEVSAIIARKHLRHVEPMQLATEFGVSVMTVLTILEQYQQGIIGQRSETWVKP